MTQTKTRQIKPNNLCIQVAGQKFNTWVAYPEAGTLFEDVQKPEYWAHVAVKFSLWDEIIVWPDESSYRARLLVVAKGPDLRAVWAKTQVLEHVEIKENTTGSELAVDGYTIKFAGRAKWRVIRDADKAVVKEDLQTKTEAFAWLQQNFGKDRAA